MLERREARLKPEFARLYEGVTPGEWVPVREMIDVVIACDLRAGRSSGEVLIRRVLQDQHFESRGGPAHPARRRQRVTDVEG